MLKAAEFSQTLSESRVGCLLCPAECKLGEGQVGICGCRFNQDGKLMTSNYGELVTLAVDPIEKKPLYHFYPTADILSTGPNGCNFSCVNCQNWQISQCKIETAYWSPEELADAANRDGSIGIAFTYTEPLIWYEYIMDVAPLLKANGQKVVLVSNGYVSPRPLEKLIGVMDAINIDLKSMRPDFYRRICKGELAPVLDNIRAIAESNVHMELTNLVIPTMNDSEEDLKQLIDFVASLSDMIPLHFSAYHPDYKLELPPTPIDTMLKARELARRKLKFVYLGNVHIPGCANTICPACKRLLVSRDGYQTRIEGLNGSKCADCGEETAIVV